MWWPRPVQTNVHNRTRTCTPLWTQLQLIFGRDLQNHERVSLHASEFVKVFPKPDQSADARTEEQSWCKAGPMPQKAAQH